MVWLGKEYYIVKLYYFIISLHCFLTSIFLLRSLKPFWFLIYCMWPVYLCFVFPFSLTCLPFSLTLSHSLILWKRLRLNLFSVFQCWNFTVMVPWVGFFLPSVLLSTYLVCHFSLETSFNSGTFSWMRSWLFLSIFCFLVFFSLNSLLG